MTITVFLEWGYGNAFGELATRFGGACCCSCFFSFVSTLTFSVLLLPALLASESGKEQWPRRGLWQTHGIGEKILISRRLSMPTFLLVCKLTPSVHRRARTRCYLLPLPCMYVFQEASKRWELLIDDDDDRSNLSVTSVAGSYPCSFPWAKIVVPFIILAVSCWVSAVLESCDVSSWSRPPLLCRFLADTLGRIDAERLGAEVLLFSPDHWRLANGWWFRTFLAK
jgi:hypothetical protein